MNSKRPKDCPLSHHRNGQWCKKVKGKLRYFGTDLDAALKRWAEEKDHLLAGLEPPRTDKSATLAELANLHHAYVKQQANEGNLRSDHPRQYKRVLGRLIESLGANARIDKLTPASWAKVRADLLLFSPSAKVGKRKQRAATTMTTDIALIKSFLNWAKEEKHISEINTGQQLKPPAARVALLAKKAKGKQLWDRGDLLRAIEAADRTFKPVLLLAINGAMGARDISLLTRSQWKRGQEFMDSVRNKTGVDRRIWLWPETRQAIEDAKNHRPEPFRQAFKNRLLLTKTGRPWQQIIDDTASDPAQQAMKRLADKLGIDRKLYDCRRTFRTKASEVCDLEAINLCMGHKERGEGATYVQEISDERIKKVCSHVREWLFKE
ncbi:tyrosine-type recombinase/integrase [Planctomycetaceae bacterium SH139]